jgi:hypothetical protein
MGKCTRILYAGKISISHVLLQVDQFQIFLYSNLPIAQIMSRDFMHIIHLQRSYLQMCKMDLCRKLSIRVKISAGKTRVLLSSPFIGAKGEP